MERMSEHELKSIQDSLDFAAKVLKNKGIGCEGFMISMNFIRAGRIEHHFSYESFPTLDWGSCMIAMAEEARRAQNVTKTHLIRQEGPKSVKKNGK